MAGLNRSECFLNGTNHTFSSLAYCTGSFIPKSVVILIYSLLMTFSLVGNVLVVAVFYRKRTLRTSVHYFIVNMAISDLILPVVTLSWMISKVCHDGLWLVDGVLGTVLCKLVWIAWDLSIFVSILSMMWIAADRFHAVLFPMKSALFSRNKRRLIITTTWIAAVVFRAHYLYGAKLVTDGTGLKCDVQWEPASYTRNVSRINWILLLCLTCVSAIVLTVLYSSIIIFLNRQKNNLHLATEVIKRRAKENRQVTRMLVVIVVAFYIVWIPYNVLGSIIFFIPTFKIPCFYSWFCHIFPFLYPVVNPMVYYIFNANYRKGFRELLCCPCPCIYKCNDCFQSLVSSQEYNNVHNAEQVNNAIENIELKEH